MNFVKIPDTNTWQLFNVTVTQKIFFSFCEETKA